MRLNLNLTLLVAYILGILYAHKLGGGLEILPLSLLTIVLIAPLARQEQIGWLVSIFVFGCVASIVAWLRYPEASFEYVKSLVSYGAALFCGYTVYLLVNSLESDQISRTCLIMASGIIALSAIEVVVPPARELSTKISERFYASEEGLERSDLRDLEEHGGARPRLGSQEPSWVSATLGVCLTGWNMTRRRKGILSFLGILVISLVVLRGPTFLITVAAGNFLYLRDAIRSNQLVALGLFFSMLALAGAVFVAVAILPENRISRMVSGADSSFNERIRMPYEFTRGALIATRGMGLGFVGTPAEPGNPALRGFFPIVVEALERSETTHMLWYYDHKDSVIAASHSAVLTHWYTHGILFGVLVICLWSGFIKTISPALLTAFFVGFVLWGLTGFGYDSIKFWTVLFMFLGFGTHYLESRNVGDEPGIDSLSTELASLSSD